MEIKIFWTDFAKNELRHIFYYYLNNSNRSVALKIVTTIVEETNILRNQPYIGQVEENLIDRKQTFRYLVCNNYKVIYWINKDKNQIEINDVFDCRQNPVKLSRNK